MRLMAGLAEGRANWPAGETVVFRKTGGSLCPPAREVLSHSRPRLRVGQSRPILLFALVTLGVVVGPAVANGGAAQSELGRQFGRSGRFYHPERDGHHWNVYAGRADRSRGRLVQRCYRILGNDVLLPSGCSQQCRDFGLFQPSLR